MAQTDPLKVTINITSLLTGKPLDATISWMEADAVHRIAAGTYTLEVRPGSRGPLTIARNGFFDQTLTIDFIEGRPQPEYDVSLTPGVPQLKVSILDEETGEPLESLVDLFTLDESSIVFSDEVYVTPYVIDLEYNKAHVLQVRCKGYFSYKDTIDFIGVFEGRVRERTINLVRLKEGNKVSLNNIYFEPNAADLTEFAQLMLDEFVHILAQEGNLTIEIAAHTDDTGANDYNQALSERRAIAVKDYLLSKGARSSQLLTRGYGESIPLFPNDSDPNRALNRRVEFKIISAQ